MIPCLNVMYALAGDAQGMIGYSREDERLQLVLEYIRHLENVHGPLMIYEEGSFELDVL